jgi:carbamoyltransferase
MTVLGISCFYHDAAAALVRDGIVVAAAQEERFTRVKHDPRFPRHAVAYCLGEAGITMAGVDAVAFYDKPFLTFERLLETYLAFAPRGLASFARAMPVWLKQKLWTPDVIAKELDYDGPILFTEHHESHAASAFFPSPFERAAILTADGVGEWATTSWGVGRGSEIDLRQEIHFPHSLGLLYSAFTYFCGFRVNSGEYKLMGLAPYGDPLYVDVILKELIDLKEDGSFKLNMDYFTYPVGLRMTGRRFEQLFGGPARLAEGPLTQREMDLARSVQVVTEEAMLRLARHVHRESGEKNLCLAGGVALNCVANGRIQREGPFERIWVQPAAGDAGGALGAALLAAYDRAGHQRPVVASDGMHGSLLGPEYGDDDIAALLAREGIDAEPMDPEALVARVADLLAEGQTVGWFQGRMEFGPRALGARSILADPRGREVWRKVNLQIKFRESFRPFAPSVLAHRSEEHFGIPGESPYMMLVGPVHGAANGEAEGLDRRHHVDSPLPAVTHVDGSARVQTVDEERSPLYFRLLEAFEARTGCPVLVNTSFNVRGEPIVCTPEDAWRCFTRTHLDALAIGPYVVTKAMLPNADGRVFSAEEIAAEYGLD